MMRALLLTLLLSSCSAEVHTAAEPSAITKPLRRYAQRLYKRGVTRANSIAKLQARGLTRPEARKLTRMVRRRDRRDADTLHSAYVSLAAPIARAGAKGALIAAALCKPIADQDGTNDAEAVACRADEAGYLGERWCVVGQTTPVIAAARARVTPDEATDLTALRDGPRLRFRLNATDNRHNNLIQGLATDRGLGAVERCIE